MDYVCGDNRFEIIERYKNELISATNIESSPEEMAVLDNILFRFWQMGWLNEQEDLGTELTNAVELIHKKNERIEKLLKEQDEEHRRLLSWLGKFCRHIDNGDAWLTDEENIAFFKEKMKQQFGWDTD